MSKAIMLNPPGGGGDLLMFEGDFIPATDKGSTSAVLSFPEFVYSDGNFIYAEVVHTDTYEAGTTNAVIKNYCRGSFDKGGSEWGYQLFSANGSFLNSSGNTASGSYGNIYGAWGFKTGNIKLGTALNTATFKAGHTYHYKIVFHNR